VWYPLRVISFRAPVVLTGCFLLAVVSFPAAAFAQSCHEPPPVGPERLVLETELSIARLTEAQGGGHAIGLAPGFAARAGRFHGSLRAPIWMLKQANLVAGIGDLVLRGGLGLADLGVARLLLEAGATLPTGDSGKGLGMGHVMLLPALALEGSAAPIVWSMRLGYARALGGGHDTHGTAGAPGPVVDPMNASEFYGAASAFVSFGLLGVTAGAVAAEPIFVHGGRRRLLATLGVQFDFGGLAFGIEGEAPLAGESHAGKGTAFLRWHP
jgi:hypothetical protein